jgi:CRP-like cAMP-binding protein
MLQVLHDGAAVAERLGRFELTLMYQSAVLTFAAAMARASKPEHWAGVLSELSLTAGHAAHPRTAVDELKQGTGLAADTYADRPRAPFAEIVDLKLVPGRPAEKPLTHPVPIENIANGHRLQVSAHDYVVVRGSLAMSRMQDGRRVPVARLGPGDLIGSSLGLPADGAQIYALEDSVLLRLSADSVSAAIAAADPVLRWTIAALSGSLRAVPDVYTPRSRAVSDSIDEMRAQVQGMAGYLNAVSASAALKGEAAPVAEMVDALTRELEQLVKARPDLDRRTQAVPLAAIPDRDG